VRALRCGEQRFAPQVRATDEGVDVTLAGRAFRFALEEEAPGAFVLREGSREVRFHVARGDAAVYLFWDGVAYALAEEREGTPVSRRQDAGSLEAPMPGRVTAVKAQAGQHVKRGAELLVVEAMKMENALRAPRDGVVRAVHVSTGDMVAPGRPLVELEAEG
jgi:3-methylcrotonyl-CoA carboxylase alpha subunit